MPARLDSGRHSQQESGQNVGHCDGVDDWVGVVDRDIVYHLPTVINQVSIQIMGGGGADCAGRCGDPSRVLALDYQPLSVGGISGGGFFLPCHGSQAVKVLLMDL